VDVLSLETSSRRVPHFFIEAQMQPEHKSQSDQRLETAMITNDRVDMMESEKVCNFLYVHSVSDDGLRHSSSSTFEASVEL
jgi:hypothetical protein